MNPSSPELDLMRAGTSARFIIQIRKFKFNARPLTIAEHMDINNEIVTELLQVPENMRHAINEQYLLAKKMLSRASSMEPGRVGPATDYLMDQMTIDEILYAYDQYLEGTKRLDPRLEEMEESELADLADAIKKKDIALTELSSWQTQNLARYLLTKCD